MSKKMCIWIKNKLLFTSYQFSIFVFVLFFFFVWNVIYSIKSNSEEKENIIIL